MSLLKKLFVRVTRRVLEVDLIRNIAHRVVPVPVKLAVLRVLNGASDELRYAWAHGEANLKQIFFRPKLKRLVPDIEKYKFVLICNKYPGKTQEYGGEFIRSRVEAYAKDGFLTLVIVVNIKNAGRHFESIGTYGCLRIHSGDLKYYLKEISRNDVSFLTHSPSPRTLSIIMKQLDPQRCFHWFHGFEIRDYRRLFYNYSTAEMESMRKALDTTFYHRKQAARECFSQQGSNKIFVSDFIAQVAERDMEQTIKNCHVIPNFIDCDHYTFQKKAPEQAKNILLIRSFSNRNYANDIAIDAIRYLSGREGFEKLRFTICGTGRLFKSLTSPLVSYPNVSVQEGYLTPRQMKDLHGQNGIFLAPSRFDTQGVLMCEAMASGLVCITNNVAAIPEYVDSGCAILARADDEKAFAHAIWKLNENSELISAMSERAGARVRRQCGFPNTIRRELDLISTQN